jgi:hypothetical protein
MYVSGFDRKRTSSITPLSRDLLFVGALGEPAASAGRVDVFIEMRV